MSGRLRERRAKIIEKFGLVLCFGTSLPYFCISYLKTKSHEKYRQQL